MGANEAEKSMVYQDMKSTGCQRNSQSVVSRTLSLASVKQILADPAI